MTVTIARWGNSLGVRIPKSVLQTAHLSEGDQVDVEGRDGEVLIKRRASVSLRELLDQITSDNLHGEQFAELVGNERW